MKDVRESYLCISLNNAWHLMSSITFSLFTLTSLSIISCESEPLTLFTEVSPAHSNVTFKNLVRESEEFNVLTFGYFYNGGGVAIGDINNDGLPDIYVTGNMMASHLYLNQGNLEFKEIAESAGVRAEGLWNTGVTMADVNADGWIDIYVCRSAAALGIRRKNLLFLNNRNNTFSESSALFGLDDQGYSTQASFLDYDRDGDLDMFLMNHSIQKYAGFSKNLSQYKNQENKAYGDRLYRNDLFVEGEEMIGRFFDVTAQVGIKSSVLGFGLGVSVDDLNGDGWPDIYVSNDYNEEDYVYINQRDGSFKNEVHQMLDQTSLFSMGNDIADINNDGLPDIVSLDMLPENHQRIQMTSGSDNYQKKQQLYQAGFHKQSMRNMLQLNNGDGTFSEVGQLAGLSNTDWSWASLIEDFDLDGDNDIFITNGYKADYTNMDFMAYAAQEQVQSEQQQKEIDVSNFISKIPSINVSNYLFENKGNIQFENISEKSGLNKAYLSNGATYADLDADGDLDLIVNHVNEKMSIYKNNTIEQGERMSIKINIEGSNKNRYGIGAQVSVLNSNKDILKTKTVSLARGFQSSVEPVILFAQKTMEDAAYVSVTWSDGIYQLKELSSLSDITIKYDVAKHVDMERKEKKTSPYKLNQSTHIDYVHDVKNFVDFDRQGLLLFKMSDYGPTAASADVNKDGLLDIYICGSNLRNGQLFVQQQNGSFILNQSFPQQSELANQKDAIFFDADSDGDLDLYVTYENYTQTNKSSPLVSDKLFLQERDGTFQESKRVVGSDESHSIVRPCDFDKDGDMDIFIGGYLNANDFPNASNSMMLMNDGKGEFKKSISQLMPDLNQNQIVTDAQWIDYDQDGDQDLIVIGHWMPVTICSNEGDHFSVTELPNSSGLWNAIEITDVNDDGYEDAILANYGKNSQLKADSVNSLLLYAADFDDNGKIDPIFCKTIDGKIYPFAFRDDLLKQIPSLKKKFNSYHEYADATIEDILTKEQLSHSDTRQVQTLATSLLINDKDGSFTIEELNWEAQQSPVYAIDLSDINDDGYIDILLGGNQVGAMEQIGPNLSNKGTILFGNGSGEFKTTGKGSSSLGIQGEVRDIIQVNEDRFIWLLHQDSILIFSTNETYDK